MESEQVENFKEKYLLFFFCVAVEDLVYMCGRWWNKFDEGSSREKGYPHDG